MPKMKLKRAPVLLAHTYDPVRVTPAGWYMSEKLDGLRCWYDGGVSRGLLASEVPWANVAKDGRYVNPIRATGLWTRQFKTIQAPSWFLDALPPYCLDGELWLQRNGFQELEKIVKKLEPGPEWEKVNYRIFDQPMPSQLFADGEIRESLWEKKLVGCYDWYLSRAKLSAPYNRDFESVVKFLGRELRGGTVATLHEQILLPYNTQEAIEAVEARLEQVTAAGGEGLILRKASSLWHPERSWNLLKVKKWLDAEGVVVGYKAGKATEKGSKLLGLMGSIRLRMGNGNEFDLSGFKDEERVMVNMHGIRADDYLSSIPGMVVPDSIENPLFPRGSKLCFKYRELTNDHIPKEARYWRS